MRQSMSLNYEPSSEPLHISAKWLEQGEHRGVAMFGGVEEGRLAPVVRLPSGVVVQGLGFRDDCLGFRF